MSFILPNIGYYADTQMAQHYPHIRYCKDRSAKLAANERLSQQKPPLPFSLYQSWQSLHLALDSVSKC